VKKQVKSESIKLHNSRSTLLMKITGVSPYLLTHLTFAPSHFQEYSDTWLDWISRNRKIIEGVQLCKYRQVSRSLVQHQFVPTQVLNCILTLENLPEIKWNLTRVLIYNNQARRSQLGNKSFLLLNLLFFSSDDFVSQCIKLTLLKHTNIYNWLWSNYLNSIKALWWVSS